MSSDLLEPIEYRKSGLSLNHIVGCPLDCSYCIRHTFNNFEMKQPHLILSDEEAVQRLIGHKFFQPHITPLQIFNRATDPLLPLVKDHTFNVLKILDSLNLTNHFLIISRYHLSEQDCVFLNSIQNLKVTLLFTYSGIKEKSIEPINSLIAEKSLKTAYINSKNYKTILYWRPLIPGVNDTEEVFEDIYRLSEFSHAVVYTGLFYRDSIEEYYQSNNITKPYASTARRKIFPNELEIKLHNFFSQKPNKVNLFRKTSCGVAFAHKVQDYNGHYSIREICDICPDDQVKRCELGHRKPTVDQVQAIANGLGDYELIAIDDRSIKIQNFKEQERYYIQHSLNYQVHDVKYPHLEGEHGRASLKTEKEGFL